MTASTTPRIYKPPEADDLPPGARGPRRYGRRYPWDDWLAKPKFTLYRGADYDCRTDSMALMVRFAGWDRHKKCAIRIHDDGLGLTVTVVPGPRVPKGYKGRRS